jgi:stage III sporulation protein SpoIIIAA/predicted RNA-binding protein Jag
MPPAIREAIKAENSLDSLVEIVLDLGRLPEARFAARMAELSTEHVVREDIDYVVSRVGRFSDDNRAGIERTLHRISAIRNRLGAVIGLTCRVGRAVFGTVDILRDVIESGASILLLGRPGVGKTTLLREAARVLADELGKRVIIVDTSNEIGGDGDIPHPGVGRARRMQVPSPNRQHAVMIEAVENHMPEVIVIDPNGTEAEALAARTIAERGVQLIATAHGNTLENLLQNPTLADLVGGIQAVTLSDEEARRRRTQKTVLERKAPPTFDAMVEIQDKDRLAVHHDLARVVDAFLRGLPLDSELRFRAEDGSVKIELAKSQPDKVSSGQEIEPVLFKPAAHKRVRRKIQRIYTYGVSRSRLERAIQKFRAPASVVTDIDRADIVLTLKSQEKRQPKRLREVVAKGVPLHLVKSNSVVQIENFLRSIFDVEDYFSGEQSALKEAETAIAVVLEKDVPLELSPQNSHLRRLQHQLAEHYGLTTKSQGKEPYLRVVIFP